MGILYVLNQSPWQSAVRWSRLRKLFTPEDALLLCGDAVYVLLGDDGNEHLQSLSYIKGIYALQEDVEARHLQVPASVRIIDYLEFVELTVTYTKTISW